jgi:LemA protein
MMEIIILFIVLGLPLIYIVAVYNTFASLKVKIKEAWSQIDVQLKRRVDLIPNLVEAVKGYVTHERELLENVTKARAALMSAKNPEEAGQADNMLSGALKSLFAVAEAYPELRAQEGFSNLQRELSDTEDKVAYSRQFYNSVVRDYNSRLVVFPSNIVGKLFGFKSEMFFEVEASERDPVKVQF